MNQTQVIVVAACPACGSTRFAALPTPGRWVGRDTFAPLRGRVGLARCRSCGLRLVSPRPDSDALAAFYSGTAHDYHDSDSSLSAGARGELLLARIEQTLPSDVPRTLLDYGCGGGGFLRQAAARGWTVQGFEPAARGLEACRRGGLDVVDSLEGIPAGSVGVVTLHHVFEHLEDPAAVLDAIRRLLAPGGLLFLEVPNVGSLRARLSFDVLSRRIRVDERYRAFPIHLNYFQPRTLKRLLERAGWVIVRRFTLGLGIEELFYRDDDGSSAEATTNVLVGVAEPSRPRRRGGLASRAIRGAVKGLILGTGLGENLCVLARPAVPVRHAGTKAETTPAKHPAPALT
jgi:SAM-dependent methyltransferase